MSIAYNILLKLFLILIFLSSAESLFARHIVGGEITYECIGQPDANTRRYAFKIYIYRDCNGGGAPFDSAPGSSDEFEMTIFRGDLPFRAPSILEDGLFIENIPVDFDNPCVIFPPDVCVERGLYVTELDLPISAETYTISYQRCCRNGSISNIEGPGNTGATYFVEISPEAQQACNSSPTFTLFPPLVICANNLLEFDHSATDAQGDELRYRLAEPYQGGGPILRDPGATGFFGVTPNPESPPPYNPVDFSPGFTSQEPVDGSNPTINIDSLTGLLQVNPQTTGQFVLAIVVEEYRNGVQIGYVHRDFQFNIVECDPLISANITAVRGADSIAPDLVLVCGNLTVELVDISTDREFIDEIKWVIPNTVGGDLISEQSVLDMEFPDYGIYPGQLIANPGYPCTDTADFNIVISPPSEVDFTFSYDTCNSGPVVFTGASSTQADSIVSYHWDFGNGDSSFQENPTYQYLIAGDRLITHSVRDNNGCEYSEEKTIAYFPVPADLLVSIENAVPCAPATVLFRQELPLITAEYNILWEFGDGSTSSELNPNFEYEEPGEYSVYVSATSPLQCFVDTQLIVPVRVLGSPIADFTFTPEAVSIADPDIFFFDQSLDAVSWQWDFDSIGTSREENPVYTFPDTGSYRIELVVSHLSGCLDTVIQYLQVNPFQSFFLPNAFTPNGDGTNEFFKGVGYTRYVSSFEMQIFNRWGELVFETNNIEASWDGRNQKNNRISPSGVYLYVINMTGLNGTEKLTGYVTLVD